MRVLRGLLTRAVQLTLALLGWELVLLWLITGELGRDAGALGLRLAWDFVLLFPLLAGALGFAGARARREGRPADAPRAATVALTFLLLLLPVAAARSLLQQRADRPPPEATGQAVSATARDTGEGRFLCSSVSPEAASGAEAEKPTPLQALWAGVQEALVLQVPLFPLALFLLRRRAPVLARPFNARTVLPGALPLLLVASGVLGSDDGGTSRELPPSAQALAGGCAPGTPVRAYAVAAIDVDLPLNAHGDHLPRGLMYVLEEALPAVREQERRPREERVRSGLREEPIQPLVLRANLGECLVLRFTNRLAEERAALRIEGLRTTRVAGPSGGFMPGDAVRAGQSLTLVLPLPSEGEAEGAYLLHDPEEDGRREARGLFGALVLEPAGSVYRDSATGEPLKGSRWEAIIDVPEGSGRDFREAVLLFHSLGPPEEADVRFATGEPLPVLDEMAGPFRPGSYGVNYRSEPRFDRADYQRSDEEERPRPRRGEQATPKLRSYLGEPSRVRALHAGSAEFHVPHLYGHAEREWPQVREEPPSSPGAARLLGPGRSVTLAFGEGSHAFPTAAGDFVYHCHIPNHGLGGLQGAWRVSTTRQMDLAPLPDRTPPP